MVIQSRLRPQVAAASVRPAAEGEAVAVARMAERIETHYGSPQDIEWAMASGKLYLLQSRPITTL